MLHLPGELLSAVLSKLPVKSLLRFRCVSKLWHSLIESPYLTNLHLNHNEQYSNNVVIIKGEYEHYASLSYLYALDFHTRNDADVEARKLEYPTLPCITSYVQACNGLLCFFPIHRQMAVIWNPATHRHRQVPLIREGQGSHKFCFGYDYKTHDYKLVKLRCLCKKETCYTIQVYSLKSDEWGPKRTCDLGDINFPIYVGGVLYWIDYKVARAESEEKIVVFDLATMERRVVSEPTKDRGILRLSYQQGCVCVSCHNDDTGHVDFWVIKDEGRNYSWSKLVTIKVPYHFSELGFTLVGNLKKKDLQQVLISAHGSHHWYYDIEKEKIKCFHFVGAFQVMNTVTYFESLVRV